MTTRILEGCERYHFLTRVQMHRLGVAKDKTHLGTVLRKLVRQGYIGKVEGFTVYRQGRLPDMFYLTRKGAEGLGELTGHNPEDFSYPHAKPNFSHDQPHRSGCVDIHIATMTYHGEKLGAYVPYYTYSGANRGSGERMHSLARVPYGTKYIIPDALFWAEGSQGPIVFAMEYIRNVEAKDTKRICDQLARHVTASQSKAVGRVLGQDRGNRILCVFEEERDIGLVRNRLRQRDTFKPHQGSDLLKAITLDRLDASNYWQNWEPMV